MGTKDRILEPFDFKKSPSMSSQMFEAAPGVFGDKDGVGPLQSINRVMIGGPVDIFDFIGRASEAGLRGAAEVAGEGYEALGGGQGMSERLKRDMYGLGQIGGLMAGASPSSVSSARVPSTRRAAPSDSTPSEGIMMALEGPKKSKGKKEMSPSEFFQNMGDEGAGLEFPEIGKALDDYVYDMNREGVLGALESPDYPGYRQVLKTNLDSLSDGNRISVSRIENYLDPMAGVEGRRTKSFFDVDKDDVLFVGSDSERELIVRGPDGGPMSVRLEADDLPSSSKIPVVRKKVLEGEIVSGPSDVFLQAQAKRDKAISKQGREVYQEEMDYMGLEDSFQTIKNDIDEGFVGAADRGFEPMDVDGFFDTFQDRVMYERMKAEGRGEKPNMGEIIAKELPETINDFERSFGLFVDPTDMVNKIAKTADDAYDFGVGKAKKRMDDAEANRRGLEAQRNVARARNEQRDYYRSMGITDDMTDEQVRDILYERQMGAQRDLAGAGIPEPKPEGPNLRVVIDNEDLD